MNLTEQIYLFMTKNKSNGKKMDNSNKRTLMKMKRTKKKIKAKFQLLTQLKITIKIVSLLTNFQNIISILK